MILIHNSKLLEENVHLKQMVEDREMVEVRVNAHGSAEMSRLKRELELKNMEIDKISQINISEKHSIRLQIDNLNEMIKKLS
jgi:hypothetical protein